MAAARRAELEQLGGVAAQGAGAAVALLPRVRQPLPRRHRQVLHRVRRQAARRLARATRSRSGSCQVKRCPVLRAGRHLVVSSSRV